MEAFDHLSSDRPIGAFGGVGCIPLSSIQAYCEMFGISDEDERQTFLSIIRAMDDEYLKIQAEKAQKQDGKDTDG